MHPKVSVCIPVYNSEEYLESCLESVARQEFKKMEVIICDDCSEGRSKQGKNCKEIVKEFKKNNKRLKVEYIRHEENKGLVEARRTLVYAAKGDYILMLDSDDYFAEAAVATLYGLAGDGNADIVHGGSKSFYMDENGKYTIDEQKVNNVYEGELLDKQIFTEAIVKESFTAFLWGKLIRREIYLEALNQIPPTYCNMAEDLLQFFFISRFAKKYVGINSCVYFYRTNTGMTSNKKKIEDLNKWEQICSTASVFTILFTWDEQQEDSEKLLPEEFMAIQRFSCKYIQNNMVQLNRAVAPELQQQAKALLCDYWGKGFVNRMEPEVEKLLKNKKELS